MSAQPTPISDEIMESVIETIDGTPQIRDRCKSWHSCMGRCFAEDASTCPVREEIREWGIRTETERDPLPPTVRSLFVQVANRTS